MRRPGFVLWILLLLWAPTGILAQNGLSYEQVSEVVPIEAGPEDPGGRVAAGNLKWIGEVQPERPAWMYPAILIDRIIMISAEEEPAIKKVPAHANRIGTRSQGAVIDSIVIHTVDIKDKNGDPIYGGAAANVVQRWSTDGSNPESAHFIIHANGDITQMVEVAQRANHAWYYNDRSIGIELDWYSKDAQARDFPKPLMDSCVRLVRSLCQRHRIRRVHPNVQATNPQKTDPKQDWVLQGGVRNYAYGTPLNLPGIVAHGQVDPLNRSDPGPHFFWDASSHPNRPQTDSFIWRINAPPRPNPVGPGIRWLTNDVITPEKLPKVPRGSVNFEWEPIAMSNWDVANHEVTGWEFTLRRWVPDGNLQSGGVWVDHVQPMALQADVLDVTLQLPGPAMYNWGVRAKNFYGNGVKSYLRYFAVP